MTKTNYFISKNKEQAINKLSRYLKSHTDILPQSITLDIEYVKDTKEYIIIMNGGK